ncbi:transcriptional regulator [Enterobacteriaceae bacterium LUAb1]
MRYNINGSLIYDAMDGTLTLAGNNEPDSQLSITASTLLYFFLCNTGVVSREEVLKKVWDDNGLTSSNSNLNQYLSMLRKTFRHYNIDNIIITVSRGHLQLNPDIIIDITGSSSTPEQVILTTQEPEPAPVKSDRLLVPEKTSAASLRTGGIYWYLTSACLLAMTIALPLFIFSLADTSKLRSLTLTQMTHSQCELLAGEDMLRSIATATYGKNFDEVRRRLKLACRPGERFVFFYGDKLQTYGMGRVFLAHCVIHENNPFSYCDNYFYYSWKP